MLDAFTAGGAQIHGGSRSRQIEIEDELEFTLGRAHQVSAGFTINRTAYYADERRNAGGTFTFATLDDFAAGVPMTFTQRVGDPVDRLFDDAVRMASAGRLPRAPHADAEHRNASRLPDPPE